MRAIRLSLCAAGALLAAVALAVVLAFNTDLGRFKPQLEDLLSGLLNREFRIEGPLSLILDLHAGLQLQAGGLHLAATDWSARPHLASIASLQLQLDIWSLFRSGPIMINQLVTEGVEVHLERNDAGLGNWVLFDDDEEPEPDLKAQRFELPVLPEQLQLGHSVITFATPQRETPVRLDLAKIEQLVAQDGQVSLAAAGVFYGEPVELTLYTDRLEDLVSLTDMDLAISGKLGEVNLTGNFAVADLLRPRRPTAQLNISGPSSEYLLNLLEIQDVTSGPLDLRLEMAPRESRMQLALHGQFGEFTTTADGRFDDLSRLQEFAVQFEARGPDLGRVARILGVPDVPNERFSLTGSVSRDGSGLVVDQATLAVDSSTLSLDATVPAFPGLAGASAAARVNIPDVNRFAPLLGLPGELSGDLDAALDVKPLVDTAGIALTASATNSDLTLAASGQILDPGLGEGSNLQFALNGPGLAPLAQALALRPGPQIPFELTGVLHRVQQGFAVEQARFQMADNQMSLQGLIGDTPLENDTDISLELSGGDLSSLLAAAGLGPNNLEHEPFHLSLALKSDAGEIQVPQWNVSIGAAGEYGVVASARFTPATAPVGSELKVKAHGPNISRLLLVAGLEDGPRADFEFNADIAGDESGYRVKWFRGRLAQERVSVEGVLGADLLSSDTRLQFETSSPAVQKALLSYGLDIPQLPESSLKASGRMIGNGKFVELEQLVIDYAGAKISVNGDLGELTDLSGTSLDVRASGQDLRRLLPPQTEFSGLSKPYSLSATLDIQENNAIVSNGKFKLDLSRLELDGELGLRPLMGGGRFEMSFHSPDLVPLLEKNGVASGREVLPTDLQLAGHWEGELWTISKLDLKAGAGELAGSGTLVGPPNFSDSNLRLQGSFLNLANFNPLVPWELPALGTRLDIHMRGEGDILRFETLDVQVGTSRLSGDITITEGDVPRVAGTLHARRLDLPALFPAPEEEVAELPMPGDRKDNERPGVLIPAKDKNRRLIPDTPVPVDVLQHFDAELSLRVDELHMVNQPEPLSNIALDVQVEKGGLAVKHFSFDGTRNGKISGSMRLEPGPQGPGLGGRLRGEQVTLGLPGSTQEELDKFPTMDVNLAFLTRGHTVRDMASGLDGYLRIEMGRGRIRSGATKILTNDFVAQLMETLNPFSQKDPYTKVRCGMVLANFVDGKVSGEPALVFRTDRIDIAADTEIDLATEKLQATFTTTPRKGLGFSLSSLVNPYVMVIGTLGNPVLSLDPEGVLVQGGAAVATGGLSIIAKGLKDRFFSDKDPCGTAALKASKEQQALEKKYADQVRTKSR